MKIGDKAPEVLGIDANGNEVKLSDFAGRKVILYFYPKDNTPGCTRQACAFAANFEKFKKLVARWIEYFKHPSYYKIDGKPVYMIFHPQNLVRGLGGIEKTREALEYFREQTKRAGFPDLHLQLCR